MTIHSTIVNEMMGKLHIGHFPGLTPRLIVGSATRENLDEYRARGGYAPGCEGDDLIAEVEASLLRGRGGAAFPLAVKLRALKDQPGEKFAVANGEEGEPASIKDRWLLRHRPHLLLDGLNRAATTIGVSKAYVYVSDPLSRSSVEAALAERPPISIDVVVHITEPAYVAGEETSVVRAINGGPAKPLDKPPRPFQSGIAGKPTLVSNVETLANLPFIATRGSAAFQSEGAGTGSPGTFLMTVSGACLRPGLYEIPMGVTLQSAIEKTAGFKGTPKAFLMGGFFAGLLGRGALDLELSYDRLRAAGSGLGCGAIVVLEQDDSPIAAVADVLSYFARETARQCGACIRGTDAMAKVVNDLAAGRANSGQVEKLRVWSQSLVGRGACNLLDGAAAVAASLLHHFPEDVENHLLGKAQSCLADANGSTSRFALTIK